MLQDTGKMPTAQPISERTTHKASQLWLALLLVGPLLLLLLRAFPALDQTVLHNPLIHVAIALSGALMGVILALLVLLVARRTQDARAFLIGMGFLCTASIFITHAIATPDVFMSGRAFATSFSAPLSLALGGVFLALSGRSLAAPASASIMHHARLWMILYFLFWLSYNWAVLVFIPASTAVATNGAGAVAIAQVAHAESDGASAELAHHSASQTQEYQQQPLANHAAPAQLAPPITVADRLNQLRVWIVIAGLGCYVFAVYRHYRLYLSTPSQVGLALVSGCALFGEALLAQYFSQVYALSFWLYHALEFIGFGAISYAMLSGYRRGMDDQSLLESILLAGTHARLQAGYSKAMDALIGTLSQGNQPTPAVRAALRAQFNLTENQMQVIEGAARAVAQERQQRQELERLNQALRDLEEHKRQITQMVVHDLKNPLTALTGYLEVLNLGQLNEDQQYLLLGALRSGKNLSGLIGDLLDVGQIEEGRLDLEYSSFAIANLLRDCAEEMHGWLLQEDKIIEVDAPAAPLLIRADQRLIGRVVINLLSNAIKHTPPKTHIWLRVAQSTGVAMHMHAEQSYSRQLIIDVEDNGAGIPASKLNRIFERFGRLNRSEANTRQTSTGLGLTFCRLVVEAHGGSISVSSVEGSGATFRVALPCE